MDSTLNNTIYKTQSNQSDPIALLEHIYEIQHIVTFIENYEQTFAQISNVDEHLQYEETLISEQNCKKQQELEQLFTTHVEELEKKLASYNLKDETFMRKVLAICREDSLAATKCALEQDYQNICRSHHINNIPTLDNLNECIRKAETQIEQFKNAKVRENSLDYAQSASDVANIEKEIQESEIRLKQQENLK